MEESMEESMDARPAGNRPGPGAGRAGMQARRPRMTPEMNQLVRMIGTGYRPGIHLSARCQRQGAVLDMQIVELLGQDLLAVPLSPESRITLQGFLERERQALDVRDGRLFDGEQPVEAEKLLRRLAHVILSLPEAQLN